MITLVPSMRCFAALVVSLRRGLAGALAELEEAQEWIAELEAAEKNSSTLPSGEARTALAAVVSRGEQA